MLTAVAASFGFDGEAWTLARLERWYGRHVATHEESALRNEEFAEFLKWRAANGRN